ncbi:MAG TPA: GTPase Era [Spirochaetales bacterium]|nr:GTPase Era [Spirochaetales bacterium]HRY54145.1 GTPase Era [Spirochaetia bacterium]HRZ65549.1 GTPase Era [Spirochaetia bacterium]
MPKSAFVAIVGRPSAGKSTLVNALCGAKVSIVSPVPQTTRNAVRGIVNRPEGQLVFLDTPGFHLSDKRLNLKLREVTVDAFADADLVLYLVDATRKPGPEEEAVAAALAPASGRLLAAVNKIDSPEADAARARLFLSAHFPEAPVFDLSALKGIGLEALLAGLYSRSPEGPAWYPEEYYTDQEPVFRIAEIIREKIMLHTRDELPHAVYVSYEDSSREEDGTLRAGFDLVVERDSQKGILIGKAGSMIRRIREEAEADLAEIFDYAIRLKLQVRVDPDWKKDPKKLESLIF